MSKAADKSIEVRVELKWNGMVGSICRVMTGKVLVSGDICLELHHNSFFNDLEIVERFDIGL